MPITIVKRGRANSASSAPAASGLSDRDFTRFCQLIYRTAGISMNQSKRALICTRLAKRLRALEFTTYGEYYDYVTRVDTSGEELQMLVNRLTTNKTEFFRERHHFDYLRDEYLPAIQRRTQQTGVRKLRVWCAAASRGHEPYTIAITLLEHLPDLAQYNIKILATDIDTEVLETARRGVYSAAELEPVGPALLQKYFRRGSGANEGLYQVKEQVRDLITFSQFNLMSPEYRFQSRIDLIFCRNVLIYFDEATRNSVVQKMRQTQQTGDLLFLGHSESLRESRQFYRSKGKTILEAVDPRHARAEGTA